MDHRSKGQLVEAIIAAGPATLAVAAGDGSLQVIAAHSGAVA